MSNSKSKTMYRNYQKYWMLPDLKVVSKQFHSFWGYLVGSKKRLQDFWGMSTSLHTYHPSPSSETNQIPAHMQSLLLSLDSKRLSILNTFFRYQFWEPKFEVNLFTISSKHKLVKNLVLRNKGTSLFFFQENATNWSMTLEKYTVLASASVFTMENGASRLTNPTEMLDCKCVKIYMIWRARDFQSMVPNTSSSHTPKHFSNVIHATSYQTCSKIKPGGNLWLNTTDLKTGHPNF